MDFGVLRRHAIKTDYTRGSLSLTKTSKMVIDRIGSVRFGSDRIYLGPLGQMLTVR